MVEKESGLASGGTPGTRMAVILQSVKGWHLSRYEWSITGLMVGLERKRLRVMERTEH